MNEIKVEVIDLNEFDERMNAKERAIYIQAMIFTLRRRGNVVMGAFNMLPGEVCIMHHEA